MRSLANGLQRMVAQMSEGSLGGCAEGVAELESSAMPAVSCGVGASARDRALAGLSASKSIQFNWNRLNYGIYIPL